MISFSIILIFCSIIHLVTLDVQEKDNPLDTYETWGIQTYAAEEGEVMGREIIKKKFGNSGIIDCRDVYKTTITPFFATVLYRTSGRLLCVGTIIDNRHVLSAKKCYEKTEPSDLKILVGCYKPYWSRFSQVSKVKKIIRHEFEIAILRTEDPFMYTDYVKAVKLPPSVTAVITEFEMISSPPFKVAGYPVDRYEVPGDLMSPNLVYQVLENYLPVTFADCMTNYTKLTLHEDKSFCTIGNASYCWGGLGGPVLKWLNTYFLQVGVVVYDNCTTMQTGPFLVARTDSYGDWIEGNSFMGHQPR